MRLAIALAVLLASGPVTAETTSGDINESELVKIEAWMHEIALATRINADPVLRAIICRIPFQEFTLETIHRATGISRARLLRAVDELGALGLVRAIPIEGEFLRIEPRNGDVLKKMRAWAYDWCASDEHCEVTR